LGTGGSTVAKWATNITVQFRLCEYSVPGVVLLGVQNVTEEIKFIIARDVAAKEKEKVNFSAAYANRLAPVYFVRNEVGHPAKHSNNTR